MKKVVLNGDQVSLEDTNLVSWTVGSYVNPITLKPVGGGQALMFGLTTAAVGFVIGGTVGAKWSARTAKALSSAKNIFSNNAAEAELET